MVDAIENKYIFSYKRKKYHYYQILSLLMSVIRYIKTQNVKFKSY